MLVRDAGAEDHAVLVDLLVEAFNWTGEVRTARKQLLADPACSHYVDGWQRAGDFGVVAVDPEAAGAGPVVGAAWARLLTGDDKGYGYVADDVPELSMALLPEYRGRGVGGLLLLALLNRARERGDRAVSLSVEDGNVAARTLYERHGFVVVGREGGSDVRLRELR